jgi:hypothetical protein
MLESFSRAFTPMRTEITATEVKVTPKPEVSEKDLKKLQRW